MNLLARLGGSLLAVTCSALVLAPVAHADTLGGQGPVLTPKVTNGCAADSQYYIASSTTSWVGDPAKKVVGPGPMTLSLAVSGSDSVTGTIGGTSGFSASGVIFAAKQDINYSIAGTVASGVTVTGTYSVPVNRTGWLQWGSWGYQYNWRHGYYTATCNWVDNMVGTGKSPTLSGKGFNHGLN